MTLPKRSRAPWYVAAFSLCCAFGVLSGAQAIGLRLARDLPPDVLQTMSLHLVPWLAWALLAPLIIAFVQRWPLHAGGWRSTWWRYALATVVAPAVHALLTFAPVTWLRSMSSDAPLPLDFLVSTLVSYELVLVNTVVTSLLQFTLIVAMCSALLATAVARERELVASTLTAQLAEAQLHALRAQLEPHFLFNALNALGSFIRDEPDVAEEMLERLSALLRGVLERSSATTVLLSDELDLTGHYLGIHELRFGDRLTVHFDVDPALERAMVPAMILQPIVENAIAHGTSMRRGASRITVAAQDLGKTLRLSVSECAREGTPVTPMGENGGGIVPGAGLGIGLSNTRARLASMYGDRSHLDLVTGDAMSRVDLVFPLEWSAGGAEHVA